LDHHRSSVLYYLQAYIYIVYFDCSYLYYYFWDPHLSKTHLTNWSIQTIDSSSSQYYSTTFLSSLLVYNPILKPYHSIYLCLSSSHNYCSSISDLPYYSCLSVTTVIGNILGSDLTIIAIVYPNGSIDLAMNWSTLSIQSLAGSINSNIKCRFSPIRQSA